MDEQQMQERSRSLGAALGRMAEAREGREVPSVVIELDEAPNFHEAVEASGRRRMFGFGSRARAAVDTE